MDSIQIFNGIISVAPDRLVYNNKQRLSESIYMFSMIFGVIVRSNRIIRVVHEQRVIIARCGFFLFIIYNYKNVCAIIWGNIHRDRHNICIFLKAF